MDTVAIYSFIASMRHGFGSLLANKPAIDGRGTIQLSIGVNNCGSNAVVSLEKPTYGPGDVTGFDTRLIVRTDPPANATDFEPNYFPAIEFTSPDFPWLFTPWTLGDRIQPWIVLVVVERDAVTTSLQATPFPSLTVLRRELPPLEDSWAWAHAQVTWSPQDHQAITREMAESQAIAGGGQVLARLIAPRRLKPRTRYYACVVPSYLIGVAAAGIAVPNGFTRADKLDPAWTTTPDNGNTLVTLPVYFSWEFATAEAGDFQSLAKQLRPAQTLPAGVGQQDLRILPKILGAQDPNIGDFTLPLEGALRPLSAIPASWPPSRKSAIHDLLVKLLETNSGAGDVPLFGLPAYGRTYLRPAAEPPPWFNDLNFDPRHRVRASLGTRVVQEDQDALMASAWDQLGEVRTNRQGLIRHAQLGFATLFSIHQKRLLPLATSTGESFLRLITPSLSRIKPQGQTITARGLLSQSLLPRGVMSPHFRRIMLGPVGSRATRRQFTTFKSLLSQLNSGVVRPAPNGLIQPPKRSPEPPPGTILFDSIRPNPQRTTFMNAAGQSSRDRLLTNRGWSEVTGALMKGEPPPKDYPDPEPREVPLHRNWDAINATFRAAANAHQAFIDKELCLPVSTIKSPLDGFDASAANGNLQKTARLLHAELHPNVTLKRRIESLVPGATEILPGNIIVPSPFSQAPQFPQPMIEPLRQLSQHFIMPGLDLIPPETVALLTPNYEFIEAYMAGLNHEMGRELLWRGYPTTMNDTYFQRFWNIDHGVADIPPLIQWTGALGKNACATCGPQVVLLIRGGLLKRYPHATIYMARADQDSTGWNPGRVEKYPMFRTSFEPDITIVGFDLSVDEIQGGAPRSVCAPGWFLVIQQNATGPRFGLEPSGPPIPKTWAEVSWASKVFGEAEYLPISNVALGPFVPSDLTWGKNSPAMAYITLRNPNRLAVHASAMIRTTAKKQLLRVTCVTVTPTGQPPETRLKTLGGTSPDGRTWQLTVTEAIAAIESGSFDLYAEASGQRVDLIVRTLANGQRYISTTGNVLVLLSLPQCQASC